MLRGSKQSKHEAGRWESSAREAEGGRGRASHAYDSDSYENHVIDLREKDKEIGFTAMDFREDDIEEGEQITGSEECPSSPLEVFTTCLQDVFQTNGFQFGGSQPNGLSVRRLGQFKSDSYEGDKDGSTAEATSASPDRELESSQGRQYLPMADCRYDDHVRADGQPANGRVGANSEVPCPREGTSQNGQFVGGEVVWAKFARFPWWPAQVQDEQSLNADFKGDKPADHNIAVRFFGTYDYAWVDPTVGLSGFDVKLQERSRTRKKALTKGVDEAIEFRATGKLPQNWDGTASESEQSSQRAQANGLIASQDGILRAKLQSEEPEQRRAARTRKPKVLFEVCHTAGARKNGAKVKERSLKQEHIGHRRPERKLRRIRIMRNLGLAPPYGSPFASEIGSRG